MLSGLPVMGQAAFLDGRFFDLSPFLDDGVVSAEVDVSRRQIAEAFVVAAVIVVRDESADAGLEVAWQIVVLNEWVKRFERDSGVRAGVPSEVAERLKAQDRENRDLRQVNEILRKASAYFAQAELDRRFKP